MSYSTARRRAVVFTLCVTSAAILADFCCELGEDSAALTWIDGAFLERRGATRSCRSFYVVANANSRIYKSRTDCRGADCLERRTVAWFIQEADACASDGTPRSEFRLNHAERRGIMPDDEIQRIAQDIDGERPMSGIFEYEVATACEALLLSGRAADARHFCDRFLRSKPAPAGPVRLRRDQSERSTRRSTKRLRMVTS